MQKLDVVLPCYNPLLNWAETIIEKVSELQQLLPQTEINIILVNDGSEKGIQQSDIDLLSKTLKYFIYLSLAVNKGKGFAVREGVKLSKNNFCVYTDVDFPYLTENLGAIYHSLIAEGNDIVVGVRDESYYLRMAGMRAPLSKILKFLNSKIFQLPVNDTQCGIKGFNQKGREVFMATRINRYLFDLEFIFLIAKKANLKFKSIPVNLRPGIAFRSFSIKILISESFSFVRLFFTKIFNNKN